MFTNLKNKLIEEVKSSKFQQFANAAQAAVSSSSTSTTPSTDSTSTANENFFSITEEDTPQNSPFRPLKLPQSGLRGRSSTPLNNGTGGISRTRKLSNSSMASDVSFRLPSYDAPASYHLQSDLEMSGSEMDDSASTTRVDVITKEQLYDAYKKSLERYNKYRMRYTDLAKKYKDLERDSAKARSVLIETQDKAMRRINELREQCALEQQAKAHLEEALRIEMDDLQCKMHAYETKLKLLGENPDSISIDASSQATGTLIDLDNSKLEQLSNSSPAVDATEAAERIAQLEKQLQKRETQLRELTEKMEKSSATIEALRKQEEENALLLAQTKQAIHSELENKESEVKKLNENVKQLQTELQTTNKREAQLNEQLGELKAMKEKLKQTISSKQEAEAKAIALEHKLSELKEQQLSKDKTQSKEYETKLHELRLQNEQLSEMVQRHQQNEVSLAEVDNELNLTKNENDTLRVSLASCEARLQQLQQQLELSNDEKAELEQKLQRLQNEATVSAANDATDSAEEQQLKSQLENKEKELKAMNNKFNKQKKQFETVQNKLKQQNDELVQLQTMLTENEQQFQHLHTQINATQTEKDELKSQVTSILQEIASMEAQMQQVQSSHAELEAEKAKLEIKIEQMQSNVDQNVKQLEAKLQSMQTENSQLAERNCLLEESCNRWEKQLAERERQQLEDDAIASDMRLKLETSETALHKLKEKIAQVLDENSRMHNAQELMDHDHRTLQDKCDALEKEKLLAIDMQQCTANELQQLKLQLNELQAMQCDDEKLKNLLQQQRQQIETLQQQQHQQQQIAKQEAEAEQKSIEMERQREQLLLLTTQNETLQAQLIEADNLAKQRMEQENSSNNELKHLKQSEANLRNELAANAAQKVELEWKLLEVESARAQNDMTINEIQQRASELETRLSEEQQQHETAKQQLQQQLSNANADIEKLHESNVSFELAIDQLKNKHQLQVAELQKLLEQLQQEQSKLLEKRNNDLLDAEKLQHYEQMQLENEYLNKHVKQLEMQLEQQSQETLSKLKESEQLGKKLQSLQCEWYVLKENAEKHDAQMSEKLLQCQQVQVELQQLKQSQEQERIEHEQQMAHAKFVNEQNDVIQNELLHAQQELKQLNAELSTLRETSANADMLNEKQIANLRAEALRYQQTIETLNKEVEDLAAVTQEKQLLQQQLTELQQEAVTVTAPVNVSSNDATHLRQLNETLQCELEALKCNSSAEIFNLKQEIDDAQIHAKQLADRIMELEQLRAGYQAQQLLSAKTANGETQDIEPADAVATTDADANSIDSAIEKQELELKLHEIMNEVRDVSDRNVFLEQKCENYLILEQSNERLKLQNSKLSRQLDETLVSMQHTENITANTEFEYLKNIMFQYLTGSANGNNETLVKVISAVLKFSPQQTQVALEKEHQRRSLINKIL